MTYSYNVGLAFSEIAQGNISRPALLFPDGRPLTYGEFDELSNRFAAILETYGVRRLDVIGIVHTKSANCFALMFAALKLGVAYVNLDDNNPPARLAHVLATAQPKIVFAETMPEGFAEAVSHATSAVIELSDAEFLVRLRDASPAAPAAMSMVTGGDPAYIMYTSGSTGIPKGAVMTHANVLNFAAWIRARFNVGVSDRLTNVNPMYFDNSVFDFYGAMLNGAALAAVPRETLNEPSKMLDFVERVECTLWFSVPSLLIYLTTLKLLTKDRLKSVKSFVFGGEGYPKPELRKLHAAFGGRSKLINVYGPTECTCMCSAWDVTPEDLQQQEGLVTLGPIAENFSMLVLDGDRQVEIGAIGELCLLGPQVGLGYSNDPERTAVSFAPNPLNTRWTERMYRTGDLVRLRADGRMIDFAGRKDNQIKHMGYRIELEEIESAAYRIRGVVQCAVLQRTNRRGGKLLVAYIASDDGLSESTLRERIAEFLPPYMVPQRFDIRSNLPKNANGKVDRVALAGEDFE